MKKRLIIFMLLLVALLASCGKKNDAENLTGDISDKSDAVSNESKKASENNSESVDAVIEHYSELYATDAIYPDKFNSLKYILIGNDNIVELLVIDGMEQTKVIGTDNVERVENKSSVGFNEIKVYDKTNQCISIMADSEDADKILKAIER